MAENNDGWVELSDSSEAWDRKGTIQGKYILMKTNVGPNNSKMYMLEVEGKGQIGVWGSTVLDGKFEQIPRGSEVKIESLGKTKSEKTGREFDNYKVMFKPVAGATVDPVAAVQDVMPGAEEVI